LTLEPFGDPVMADDGNTYERAAIEEWLTKHDVSPMSGTKMEDKKLRPNRSIEQIIKDYIQKNT